jgi:hypothetical protein
VFIPRLDAAIRALGTAAARDTCVRGRARELLMAPLGAQRRGVKAFSYRRVKNDEKDAADLAGPLRMGRLPEAWNALPAGSPFTYPRWSSISAPSAGSITFAVI